MDGFVAGKPLVRRTNTSDYFVRGMYRARDGTKSKRCIN
jgi:hypothetical protein